MLRTAEDCCHGPVTAKVADFGLSRIMDVQSRMQTRMYGTVRPISASASQTVSRLWRCAKDANIARLGLSKGHG